MMNHSLMKRLGLWGADVVTSSSDSEEDFPKAGVFWNVLSSVLVYD